ncbi:unnamed protein product [Rhizopus stolonifer]
MSTLNERIRAYSKSLLDNETINIEEFLNHSGNKTAVQDWIHNYKTPATAETSFKRKVAAVHRKLPKKQRKTLTGTTNWERLLEDAKTRQTFLLNSSRVLRNSATVVANDLINSLNTQATEEEESVEEEESIEKVDQIAVGTPIDDLSESYFFLKSGMDITPQWQQYKTISKEKARKQGLSIVSDLQKALSLSHIMLLAPEANDKEMLDLYGINTLSCMYREIRSQYIDKDVAFDLNLTKDVKNIITDLEDESISRVEAIIKMANLMKDQEDEERSLLQALLNCITKLPKTKTCSVIGEAELISNYLDPILSPMFHQPDNHKLFRWLNKKNKESKKVDIKTRPDGGMSLTEQLHSVFALGFCEIKSSNAMNRHKLTHTDTFRLAMFCKNAIDDGKIKCTIAVQSVGTYVTFFLCALQANAFYPFVQLARVTIPTSIDNLSDFVAHLDTCKRIIHTYNKFCVPVENEEKSSLRRVSLNQQQIDDAITEDNDLTLPSLLYS